MQVGDWDTTFVAEGETVEFYPLILDGSSWAIGITEISFGETTIMSHFVEWGIVDTNAPGLGLKGKHFKEVSDILVDIDPTIFCD